jgi:two-component system, LytTR family, sensor kinase
MFRVKYRYIFILLLAVYSYLNIIFTEGDRLFGYEIHPLLFIGTLLLMVALIWEGNRLVEHSTERLPTRIAKTIHPLIYQFVLSLGMVLLSVMLTLLILMTIVQDFADHSWLHMKLASGFGFRVNLFLNCVNAIVYFMNKLKRTQLEAEILKQQNTEARFEALRNQVNPHFLFNCFNVLSTLVYKDADASARFIQQLSEVYRYLLSNQDNKVVSLQNELEFMDAYTYLLKTRFRENLHIENTIAPEARFKFVAPSTLQLLVENAIKHNVVSKENPLKIKIWNENGHLVVENNLQPKAITEPSTKVGLQNIRSRYAFLAEKEVVINKTPDKFVVKVPLIEPLQG